MSELTLVTGGNGFLALHIIHQLLANNHPVRATLRNLNKADAVRNAMAATGVSTDQLSFVKADLLNDDDWPKAMQDVTYVMSVAAPVFVNGETTTDEMNQTAKNGTLRILKAAKSAAVKRVVMTANFGAVGFSNHTTRPTTEADWTDPNEPGLSDYERSKLLAERAAWNFARKENLDFATVAAGAMLGKPLAGHISGSFGLVNQLLDGSSKFIPDIEFVISNVEDVANAHVRAMFTPEASDQRFLATNGAITLPQIATLIRKQRPALVEKLPHRILPAWVIRLAAPFSAQARNGKLFLSINHHPSTQNAQQRLGWQAKHSVNETILTTVDALQA
ncbi:NAD-dependent epimerase/dehydratase family protein [Lacticaseibacillus porcinae]|uniref:NAD-dependent epimerase/dehydratase family protein n=1 Tax=Lacticaseibacillus porcinae TaxID=1123687 RepID=UPI000F7A8B68|nr:NAD-dependent epimerase/dehydratase family protein [Lacticaseibacillus porcinae]